MRFFKNLKFITMRLLKIFSNSQGFIFYFCFREIHMYILKIKGTAKIPDYVQLRDEDFTLIAYFRVDRPEKALIKAGLGDKEDKIIEIINELPFGKVQKLEI